MRASIGFEMDTDFDANEGSGVRITVKITRNNRTHTSENTPAACIAPACNMFKAVNFVINHPKDLTVS
ncbi:hypothetical protein IH799_10195 [candidate division KSB1 bacterium]|nr:hypothetical protein [candidate division KSB1 bacterium]